MFKIYSGPSVFGENQGKRFVEPPVHTVSMQEQPDHAYGVYPRSRIIQYQIEEAGVDQKPHCGLMPTPWEGQRFLLDLDFLLLTEDIQSQSVRFVHRRLKYTEKAEAVSSLVLSKIVFLSTSVAPPFSFCSASPIVILAMTISEIQA
ncbi:hypothetical protein J6590_099554 [Homalodisca vitripennis]|nr:hypothetical protein J6590_067677 [Homalodisca vitripennis]KAG8274819.1 hypothetical protein J6590_099554 [Homalodisca vitripennis]